MDSILRVGTSPEAPGGALNQYSADLAIPNDSDGHHAGLWLDILRGFTD
jgi:hypothetical protein